ncbi:hypothetical protein EMIT079MI2_10408 [Bacillus sp. IT-79MI2]
MPIYPSFLKIKIKYRMLENSATYILRLDGYM